MHYHRHFILTILAGLALTWGPVHAQQEGDRLRIQVNDDLIVGTVIAINPHAIRLDTPGGVKEYPRHQIRTIEKRVVAGTHATDGFVAGMGLGFILGGVSGMIATGALSEDETNGAEPTEGIAQEEEGGNMVVITIAAIIGAFVPGMYPFGFIGRDIGETLEKEEWKTLKPKVAAGRFQIRPMTTLSHNSAFVGASIYF